MPAYAPALHAACDERIAALRRINEQQAERIAELEDALGNKVAKDWAESPLLSHVRCARQIRLQRERIAELEAECAERPRVADSDPRPASANEQERWRKQHSIALIKLLRAAYGHGLNRGSTGRGKSEDEAVAYVMAWGL